MIDGRLIRALEWSRLNRLVVDVTSVWTSRVTLRRRNDLIRVKRDPGEEPIINLIRVFSAARFLTRNS